MLPKPLPNQYIDIHSHHQANVEGIYRIYNLFISDIRDRIPEFPLSLSLHPWHLEAYKDVDGALNILKRYSKNENVLAIGEVGLDKIILTSIDEQIRIFTLLAEWAEKMNKPMIIHCVKAYNELLEIRKKTGAKQPWVIHGFNSKAGVVKDLVRHGFYLSVGEKLLRDYEKAKSVIMAIPLSNIFIETDDDDLSLEAIYDQVAEIKGLSKKELKEYILGNFLNVFK
jgi:TatD DNase family protein